MNDYTFVEKDVNKPDLDMGGEDMEEMLDCFDEKYWDKKYLNDMQSKLNNRILVFDNKGHVNMFNKNDKK